MQFNGIENGKMRFKKPADNFTLMMKNDFGISLCIAIENQVAHKQFCEQVYNCIETQSTIEWACEWSVCARFSEKLQYFFSFALDEKRATDDDHLRWSHRRDDVF